MVAERPFVYVYKHVESRRHVNVDRDGSPYRFLPVGETGQYRTASFQRAVWQLDPPFIREVKGTRRRPHGGEDDWWDDAHETDRWGGPIEPAPGRHLRVVL